MEEGDGPSKDEHGVGLKEGKERSDCDEGETGEGQGAEKRSRYAFPGWRSHPSPRSPDPTCGQCLPPKHPTAQSPSPAIPVLSVPQTWPLPLLSISGPPHLGPPMTEHHPSFSFLLPFPQLLLSPSPSHQPHVMFTWAESPLPCLCCAALAPPPLCLMTSYSTINT